MPCDKQSKNYEHLLPSHFHYEHKTIEKSCNPYAERPRSNEISTRLFKMSQQILPLDSLVNDMHVHPYLINKNTIINISAQTVSRAVSWTRMHISLMPTEKLFVPSALNVLLKYSQNIEKLPGVSTVNPK